MLNIVNRCIIQDMILLKQGQYVRGNLSMVLVILTSGSEPDESLVRWDFGLPGNLHRFFFGIDLVSSKEGQLISCT